MTRLLSALKGLFRQVLSSRPATISSLAFSLSLFTSHAAFAEDPVCGDVICGEGCAEGCGDGCGESLGAYSSLFEGSLCERRYLLGDFGGFREGAVSNGYQLNVSTTQFYQGVTSGGVSHNFEHSGRNDYMLNVDGEKAGLWKGLFITMHGETRYGDNLGLASGAIMPTNFAMLFPQRSGTETALTSLKITQALSEEFVLFGGKLNMVDEIQQPFAGGRGVDAFMNTGLAFPAVAGRTVPYSTLGGGFAVLQDLAPVFTFMVLNTANTPTTSGFEELFTNGATMLGSVNVPVELLGKPGHQGITATYSTATYSNLDPTAYLDPNVGLVLGTGTDEGSWSLTYSADQALFVDPHNPQRKFGLFTNLGIADNGPNPVRWSANAGLGGSSPVTSRPLDTFGVGYSYVGYSDPVKDLAPILLPVGDDAAVELFYNIAVTPWFRVTPDLQILMPARERTLPPGAQDIDTAVVFGVRGKIEF